MRYKSKHARTKISRRWTFKSWRHLSLLLEQKVYKPEPARTECPTAAQLKEWFKETNPDVLNTLIGKHLYEGCMKCQAELKSHLLSSMEEEK